METEEDIKILESIIKINNDYLKGVENQTINHKEIKALEHILSDYKKLQEEFKQVDHECDRLEKIDFEKDMRIIELQKENEELRESNKKLYEIGQEMCKQDKYTRENYISVQKIKDKIEELNKAYEDSKDENGESEYYYPDYTIRVLEELLESEE